MKKIFQWLLPCLLIAGISLASNITGPFTFNGLTNVDVPTPSNGDVAKFNSTTSAWESNPDNPTEDYILIQDLKAAGTAGGTCTTGDWRTRDLNTEVADTGALVSLSSNQMSLDPGTYRVRASAPAYAVDYHQIRLQNITDGTTTVKGTSEYTVSTSAVETRAFLFGRFTIATAKTFELQHRCITTSTTNGFGLAHSDLGSTIYSIVEFWKEGSGPTTFSFSGALVASTANQAITASVNTAVNFQSETYDTSAYHDNATNNTRLTVPSGVSRVRVCGGVQWGSATDGQRNLFFTKNAGNFAGSPVQEIGATTGADFISTCTGVLEVSAADYFEMIVSHTSATDPLNVNNGNFTWFSIEAIN